MGRRANEARGSCHLTTQGRWILLSGACVLSASCGNLGGEEPPPVAALRGTLTNAAEMKVTGPLRVALVWSNVDLAQAAFENASDGDGAVLPETRPRNGAGSWTVTQELALEPKFPASFELALREPPPAHMLFGGDSLPEDARALWPAEARMAVGLLVVYEDRNANGRLDLLEVDADGKDKLVAATGSMLLVYFEQAVPHALFDSEEYPELFEGEPMLGYNLVVTPGCFFDEPCNEQVRWLPPDQPFEMALGDDPIVSTLLCANAGSRTEVTEVRDMGDTVPSRYPHPGDVKCSADGRIYRVDHCAQSRPGGLCGTSYSGCVRELWHLPDPAPFEWPCPLGPRPR